MTEEWVSQFLSTVHFNGRNRQQMIIQKMIPFLSDDNLSVQYLTKVLYKSRRQLYRDIKRLFGMPVATLIRELRLYRARWMLKNAAVESVQELSHRSGFRHCYYFCTIYAERFGVRPEKLLQTGMITTSKKGSVAYMAD